MAYIIADYSPSYVVSLCSTILGYTKEDLEETYYKLFLNSYYNDDRDVKRILKKIREVERVVDGCIEILNSNKYIIKSVEDAGLKLDNLAIEMGYISNLWKQMRIELSDISSCECCDYSYELKQLDLSMEIASTCLSLFLNLQQIGLLEYEKIEDLINESLKKPTIYLEGDSSINKKARPLILDLTRKYNAKVVYLDENNPAIERLKKLCSEGEDGRAKLFSREYMSKLYSLRIDYWLEKISEENAIIIVDKHHLWNAAKNDPFIKTIEWLETTYSLPICGFGNFDEKLVEKNYKVEIIEIMPYKVEIFI